ncbi:hypothetical protein BB560_002685 [Smittium megazygosporum]|uniref:Uncharacterized protein n=1 Tax=Smittium megazygosporum TaxID=133381 RepID=A0A2T9ZE38_9FUNG|nr:hypothetical protein BB560_002685 [Smittium megazygosporum]
MSIEACPSSLLSQERSISSKRNSSAIFHNMHIQIEPVSFARITSFHQKQLYDAKNSPRFTYIHKDDS